MVRDDDDDYGKGGRARQAGYDEDAELADVGVGDDAPWPGRRSLTDMMGGPPGDGAARSPVSMGMDAPATGRAKTFTPAVPMSGADNARGKAAAATTGSDVSFGAEPTVSSGVSVGRIGDGQGKAASEVDPRKMMVNTSRLDPAGPNATAAMAGGGYWGWCDTEVVKPNLHVEKAGTEYKVKTVDFFGQYSKIVTLVPGVKEAGTPTATNYKKMCDDLDSLGDGPSLQWYMLKAVDAHESVHESRLKPALSAVEATLAAKFTPLKVAESGTINSEATAEAAIKLQPAYLTALGECRDIWDAKYVTLITGDHTTLTPAAEHAVVDPKIAQINEWAKAQTPALPEWKKGP